MFPFMMHSGSGVTITLVGSSTSATATITLPAASAAGDLAVLFDVAKSIDVTTPSFVSPSGFSTIMSDLTGTVGGVGVRSNPTHKVLTGGESLLTGMNGTGSNTKMARVYRIAGGSWTSSGSWPSVKGISATVPTGGNVDPSTGMGAGTSAGVMFGMVWV